MVQVGIIMSIALMAINVVPLFQKQRVLGDAASFLPIHIETPQEVRGIYWTAWTAGDRQKRNELLTYMKETGLNTVVIDLKTDDGHIAFKSLHADFAPYVSEEIAIPNIEGLLEELADNNIYRIARIAVMRDAAFGIAHPEVALHTQNGRLWYDAIGSVWLDPASPEVADYAIDLAREAYYHGFDEVQFDYVRFPSDGSLNHIKYPVYNKKERKTAVMQRFFEHVGGTLRQEGIPVSFDVFGMTLWTTEDFNIGQQIDTILPHADYISPMVYPSHYPPNFKGYPEPALHPYDIVYKSLEEGKRLFVDQLQITDEHTFRTRMRPWLQDFDIGAVYTSGMIEAQIKATRDAGASGWILWNARNVYEPAQYIGDF